MATKTKAKSRTKKQYLPGLEPPSHKDVDGAAETYYDAMMERTKLSKEESEAMDNLVELMTKHGITHYETPDGLVISVLSKTKAKVKKKKDVAESNGEATGDGE
jgi:tRNA C32,U32 (ribose-2'-O)-methylase TrmJ